LPAAGEQGGDRKTDARACCSSGRFFSQNLARYIGPLKGRLIANLGKQLWQHPDDGKTAAIRLVAISFTARCASKALCSKRATILLEGRDRIGHPIWHRELCDAHTKPLIARAQALSVQIYWH
jgi:hypothetical protein